MKKPNQQFTMISYDILSSTKLTPNQKLIIAYVVGWQKDGKVCFESNSTLAKRFGLSIKGLKNNITSLNKLPFFISSETSNFNEYGKWENSKQMVVDEALLSEFLVSKEPVQPAKEIKLDINPIDKIKTLDEDSPVMIPVNNTEPKEEPMIQQTTVTKTTELQSKDGLLKLLRQHHTKLDYTKVSSVFNMIESKQLELQKDQQEILDFYSLHQVCKA